MLKCRLKATYEDCVECLEKDYKYYTDSMNCKDCTCRNERWFHVEEVGMQYVNVTDNDETKCYGINRVYEWKEG